MNENEPSDHVSWDTIHIHLLQKDRTGRTMDELSLVFGDYENQIANEITFALVRHLLAFFEKMSEAKHRDRKESLLAARKTLAKMTESLQEARQEAPRK